MHTSKLQIEIIARQGISKPANSSLVRFLLLPSALYYRIGISISNAEKFLIVL